MKNIFKLLLSLSLILSITLSGNTQSLSLIKDGKTKVIEKGHLIEFYMSEENNPMVHCTNCLHIEGFFDKIEGDSISFLLQKFYSSYSSTYKIEEKNISQFDKNTAFKFAKEDIDVLRILKSKKRVKRKNFFAGMGTVLLITGAATALNCFAVKGKANRKTLLISSAAQVGVAVTLGIMSTNKEYYFNKEDGDVWSFE